jgi:hypothetical protein
VSEARTEEGLLEDLAFELDFLRTTEPKVCETTLLIHPYVLRDFIEYNDFLGVCDALIAQRGLDGEIQIASFHPDYQFAGTAPQDVENHTNRSPYPTLHLLREASVERVLADIEDPRQIYERNIRTLRALGRDGVEKLRRAR